MNPELKNILLNLIAITLLLQAIYFLIVGNDPNTAAFVGANAIILTPKIPTPRWLDILGFGASMAALGYLANIS